MNFKLDHDTLVPISFVLVLMGGMGWMTRLDARVANVEQASQTIFKIADDISHIRQEIAEVRGELKRIRSK